MNALFWKILLFISCITHSFGQTPFDCNGRSYRVLAADEGTYLQEIQQNESAETISFVNLHFFPNHDINAIAYHPSQNVIYGVLQTHPYRLCRIDASYNLEILQTLPLSEDLVFVSGDISPDEQHLVIFGFGPNNVENIVVLINVQNGGYDSQTLTLQTTNPIQPFIYCADIAFHPTTGNLFGFDFKNGRLVTLDIKNRLIDNEFYPIADIVIGNVPSIFFNAKGELFGIGTNLQEETENRAYYQFDMATGQPTILQEMEIEKNQDACSCPYQIKLLNRVRQRNNVPCTELAFELTLINRTDIEQFDLTLRDTFPAGMSIKSIGVLPIDGIIESGIGSNILAIKNLELPIGVFSFEIILDIQEDINVGNYENQAVLTGLQIQDINLNSVLSDDPKTAIPGDATEFSVDSLNDPFDNRFFGICKGGNTTLQTGISGASSYEWSTGEATEAITVSTEGTYQVTITTDCAEVYGIATVVLDEIHLELGNDQAVERGETIQIKPTYNSHSHITSFNWKTSSQALDCSVCKNQNVQLWSDTDFELMMENGTGCKTSDKLSVKVDDVEIYMPNVFKPYDDYLNDLFYFQGNLPFDVAQFQIFDRWGNLLFQRRNSIANQHHDGWDGTQNGKDCPAGIYLWTAIIAYKTGERKTISGDVMLVR